MDSPALSLAESIAAAQEWWRAAGVDCDYHEEAQAWLTEPEAERAAPSPPQARTVKAPPPEPERPKAGGDRASWPADLEAFHDWWLAEPTLDIGGTFPRVAPRGSPKARLLVLVPTPEEMDTERLLSGAHGRLVGTMAQAMGIAEDALYVAAALPRHLPVPDWEDLHRQGFGEILRHHLALARPQRLIVLGQRILPLLGHDPAQAAPARVQTDIGNIRIPTLTSYAPEGLLTRPAWRAGLWRAWLDWTEEDA